MKYISTIAILAAVLHLAGCDDNDMNPKSQDLKFLTAATWSHADVSHTTDGNLSDQYQNFAISFSNNAGDGYEGTFLISNGGFAFPENAGKWKFNAELDQIIFDSGRAIQYEVDKNALHLDFTISAPGGRTNGLGGHFIFDLKPL